MPARPSPRPEPSHTAGSVRRVTATGAALSWRHHLPTGAEFDPVGAVESAGLPAAWARAWSAAPEAPLLRFVGSGGGPGSGGGVESGGPGGGRGGGPDGDGPDGDGRWVRARELSERSAWAAGQLAGWGVGPGAVVLWSPARTLSAVLSHLGALRAGATVVPVNPASSERELAYIVGDVRPTAALVPGPGVARLLVGKAVPLVLDHDLEPAVVDGAALRPAPVPLRLDAGAGADPALVAYTSGTTGSPKGAVLSHGSLLANSRALAAAWRWAPDDRLVHALPLFHGHGLCAALYTSLLVGASAVVLPGFDVDAVCRCASEQGATLFFGVPTMYHRITTAGRASELGRLRLAVSGSAPLASGLHEEMAAAGTVVLERYGMTETLLTVSNPVHGERRAGTVGFPLPGIEVDIDDGGQLLVRGPQVFAGYLGRPAHNAEVFASGWFRTGDLAEVCDGYVRIVGRAGDLIISGGFNVYPAEVEDVLLRHPAVAEVAVAGTPSDEWGEVVTAWVVPGVAGLDAESLLRFAAGELASYKRPRLVRLVDSLPRNAMGKVMRSQLV